MNFLIADTFTDSLTKLTGEEQKSVKTTAFDLQMNPANPGMKFHKLEKAKDKNFWSVRVSKDIRLILHKTESNLTLCYVDHHDDAYRWAERRKLEAHPQTGAAQFVEIRETVKEITVPTYVITEPIEKQKPKLFAHLDDETILSYGVPGEWINDVKSADEDQFLELVEHLPYEASEALWDIINGKVPVVPEPVEVGGDPFEHPDAKRRFRVVANVEELERALDFPWEKWAIFLHPQQRTIVERDFNGAARVAGTAGTGKTVVALHRAAFLARSNPGARVLLTTFSTPLANSLQQKLIRLIHNEPRLGERIEVFSLNSIAMRLYETHFKKAEIVSEKQMIEIIKTAAEKVKDHSFSITFLAMEWRDVVDAWQLNSWEEYRDVLRIGRKTRLREDKRKIIWSIFEQVRAMLNEQSLQTVPNIFHRLTEKYSNSDKLPYEYVVVDEAQDVSVSQLRFLATLASNSANGLFFAGDLGQRIFQQPFSWKALGVDVRGRSKTLRINYRTSHQIRKQADLLLDPEISDVDGNVEDRRGAISVFNGPKPEVKTFDSASNEISAVSKWLNERLDENILPHEIGVFVRSENELSRARDAVKKAGLSSVILDDKVEIKTGCVSISSMHLAKGLEFRVVVVMACDDEVIPSQSRIENVGDTADLEEVYNTERHLLYVACTRARDHLFVSGVEPASEFLDDLRMDDKSNE